MNENLKLQLLDRTYIISDNFDNHILRFVEEVQFNSAGLKTDKELLNKVTEISKSLGELYQLIGNLK